MSRQRSLSVKDEDQLWKAIEAGIEVALAASYLKISESTAYRVLKKLRAVRGPEKRPNRQSARWHLTAGQNASPVRTE